MKYQKSDYMPEKAKRSNILSHFYGKQKPNSPDGDDSGLQEVYDCWDFPQTTSTTIHVLPTWRDSAPFWEEQWDAKSFDSKYPAQLANAGISEEAYKEIFHPLNQILATFSPFQHKDEIFGRKEGGEDSSFYILELRKRLRKASENFPETRWSLHVHKFAADLAGNLFTETVLHSVQIKLLNQVSTRQDNEVETEDKSNSVSTLSPSQALKLEDVGKEDGTATAPSPKPNYGDAAIKNDGYARHLGDKRREEEQSEDHPNIARIDRINGGEA